MEQIRNLIFDLGGVVYDIRYENLADKLEEYGIQNMEGFYTKDFQTHWMDLFETGQLSAAEYRDYLRNLAHSDLPDEKVDEVVNAILIDVPKERVALLLALRQKYRVFLFSNTNEINYDCFTQRMRDKFGFDMFAACFEHCYYSHHLHLRKPDVRGFQIILEEQHLKPEETLFIDDIAKNAAGARKAGIHAHHLATGNILELFDEGFNLKIDFTND